MGTPRAFTFSTYHPSDPPSVGKDNRPDFTHQSDALRDAMWRLAERIGGDYQLPPDLAMRLLQDRPTPDEVRG